MKKRKPRKNHNNGSNDLITDNEQEFLQEQTQELHSLLIRFISHKDRSISEVRNRGRKYLEQQEGLEKAGSEELLERVIDALKGSGLLDDKKYARTYIFEQKERRIPRGPLYIRNFLFKKGIPKEIVDQSLRTDYSREEETALIMKIADIKKNLPYRKKINYLLRRGFNKSLVYENIME